MPPKGQTPPASALPPAKPSDSRALTTRGDRSVHARGKREVNKRGGREVGEARKSSVHKDQYGRRPTTTKALVLRNGKQGAMGTGEMTMFNGKISGREKLELLAEDLMNNAATALAAPFDWDKSKKLAESQYNDRLDECSRLRDADLLHDAIKAEVEARTVPIVVRNRPQDPFADKERVASVVGTMVHNAHMFASGWQTIRALMHDVDKPNSDTVATEIAVNEAYREKYLVLLDFLDTIVDATYSNVQVLLTTAPHYKKYFKARIGDRSAEPTMQFDWIALRDAYRSFLDSIMVELCLPSSPLPKRVLFQILSEAVSEAPREGKRFPQVLWDAIGDLSIALELQEVLMTPLRNPKGQEYRNAPRQASEDLLRWQDAQLFSERATQFVNNFKGIIFPLERTRRKDVINDMWKQIADNYSNVCKTDVETLWGLSSALNRRPTWHPPPKKPQNQEGPRRLEFGAETDNKTADDNDDEKSASSMPELQSISDESDDDQDDEEFESEEEDTDSDYETEDEDDEEYDSEDEDLLRDLEREAMAYATQIPDMFEGPPTDQLEDVPTDKKDNPFIKLLGNLRGRAFSSKPKLRTTASQEPRGGFSSSIPVAPGVARQVNRPQAETAKGSVRIDEVEDEDTPGAGESKKKKKKKPKKKKAPGEGDDLAAVAEEGEGDAEDEVPELAVPTEEKPAPADPMSPDSAAKKAANKKKKKKPVSKSTGLGVGIYGESQSSLWSGTTVAEAQSAHAYLKESGTGEAREKMKTRAAHSTMFNESADKKGNAIALPEPSRARQMFSKLKKKTKTCMRKLMGTHDEEDKQGMRWEQFVQCMVDMGFSYDPTTAGSSVRFDPPNKEDGTITFHKPHPNTVLSPGKVKEYRKKLRDRYGWISDDFYD